MALDKKLFTKELTEYFEKKILPFWKGLRDDEFGGYYGLLDFNLELDKKAIKGCTLNSRILWFFSNAYLEGFEDDILPFAHHAFEYLKDYCLDKENGGVYWSLTYDGQPWDTIKNTYNQAYAIYALASYYDATKNEEALKLAYELYDIIESKCKDQIGYLDTFTIDWQLTEDDKLSENGVIAEKTMNTHLHLFEAYTELYRVTQDIKVADSLLFILDKFEKNIYNPILCRQEVFFDKEFHSILDLHSYGHDIETCWLLDRGMKILGNKGEAYSEQISLMTKNMAEQILKVAYKEDSIMSECDRGTVNALRVWWVQCEGIIGFYNEYQKSGREKFAEASYHIWKYILTSIDDKREGSEWYSEVDENGAPNQEKPIVEIWKCPYHNGRMFFELIRRLDVPLKNR